MEKNLIHTIAVIFASTFIAFMIFILVKICNKNYNDKLNNPPSKIFVEEDLETIFLSTQVDVIETKNEGELVVYTVKANGYKYKVLYQLCATEYLGHYSWRYVRHTQIQD